MEVFTNIKEKELTSLAAEQKKHNRLFFILFNPIINLGHMMGHCSISVDRDKTILLLQPDVVVF